MISVIIVTAKCSTASACNNPSDSITEIVRLEPFDYYNQKQNEVLYVKRQTKLTFTWHTPNRVNIK